MVDTLLQSLPPEWHLSEPELFTETHTSRIIMVRLEDGQLAVVKQLNANGMENELRGTHYLDWHDGHGCVRVLKQQDNNLLLEYGGSRTLLDHLNEHGDESATLIFTDVFLQLQQTFNSKKPITPDFVPLRKQFSSLFKKAEKDRKAGAQSIFVEVAGIADRLLNNQRDIRPLHGDIHHENILFGKRGWLVIDPQALLGDPAYDAANMFYNPVERTDLRTDPKRVAAMAEIFERVFNRDRKDYLEFGISHACLSASWHEEDEDEEERDRSLAVAIAIRGVLASLA
ncbi:aminoglycoside phosphotransferase family protein [Phyllobacterium sp. YR531]|uniref:aminoglycoside phosphotransferase family protein n=1 Tax=Phyllobacterium sp. YR531 TaxID=1144343 RepID=UPI00026F48F0|nr:aminoglycoside phosphotransferase family protein [Phyllobacterium sp. YR531]EJN06484.1 streptomycin 6-kinase [Phyllobacterium sp. YR531]